MINYDFVYRILTFASIMIATYIISKIFSFIIGGIFGTWVPIVRTHAKRLASVVIWLIGLMLAIEQLGLDINFLILLIGLLGVGALIAVRGTLENMGAKYFSDVYVPFKIGDVIKVANSSGKVIEINPITTVLLTNDERLVSVPNSVFIKEKIENVTPHVWKELQVPISVRSNVDLAEFESEVLKSCNKMRKHLDERFPPVLTIKSRDKRSVRLALTLMVKEPSRKSEIIDEINKKISEIEDKMRRKVKGTKSEATNKTIES
jgi:small conductance mechanosensitive channel